MTKNSLFRTACLGRATEI